jgi:hypothetical protein
MSSIRSNLSRGSCGAAAIRTQVTRSCQKRMSAGLELTSLTAIVRHYVFNFQPVHEHELVWFRNQASLEDALRFAAHAEDDRGRRYSHQRRIKRQAITHAFRALADVQDDLQNCLSFHELWNLIGSCLAAIKGVRALYVYDCALRLGAHLRLNPEKVYLHAGTRIGAMNLGLLSGTDARKQWLDPTELPAALRKLPPLDVENLLCIYQVELAQLKE